MNELINSNDLTMSNQIDYVDRVILSLLKITSYRATREQVIDYINADGDELHSIISDRVPFWMQTTAAMDAAQIMADGTVEWDEDRIIKDKRGDHLYAQSQIKTGEDQ